MSEADKIAGMFADRTAEEKAGVTPATDELREHETCTRCGREQRLAWSVDHTLWKLADLKAEGDLLCIECFLEHCERNGVLFKFSEFRFLSLPHTICPDGDILARLDAETAARKKAERGPCTWTEDEYHGAFDTSCGRRFCFETGGISENRYVFCPGCGAQIVEAQRAVSDE